MKMKRHLHDMSNYVDGTCKFGQLVPVNCLETLPGDTHVLESSALLRLEEQFRPVMHPTHVRLHHFFVPSRLLWDGWEDFITGKSEIAPPTITLTSAAEASIYDHMGCQVPPITQSYDVNAMPARAYNMIYNEYYRDQDIAAERGLDEITLANIAWEKDRFTTARDEPQQGDSVLIPIGQNGSVPVTGSITNPAIVHNITGDANTGPSGFDNALVPNGQDGQITIGDPAYDLSADFTTVETIDVIELRRSLAFQRIKEARSRYGSRYVDLLRHWGVTPSDSRIQRPEYLGGGKQTINWSEVLRTDAEAGEQAGHGIAALKSNRSKYYCEEYGYIVTMMSIRPKHVIASGVPRRFTRSTQEDYFFPELQHIGQQEIKNKELNALHTDPDGTFGWGDKYAEYKEQESYVCGQMRTSLDWDRHFARFLPNNVVLNEDFIKCVPDERVFKFAVSDVQPVHYMNYNRVASRRFVKRNPENKIL